MAEGYAFGDAILNKDKIDKLVKSWKAPVIIIPVKTGIQKNQSRGGSDGLGDFLRDYQACYK